MSSIILEKSTKIFHKSEKSIICRREMQISTNINEKLYHLKIYLPVNGDIRIKVFLNKQIGGFVNLKGAFCAFPGWHTKMKKTSSIIFTTNQIY